VGNAVRRSAWRERLFRPNLKALGAGQTSRGWRDTGRHVRRCYADDNQQKERGENNLD
jgi:hypothetical protein